MDHRKYSYTDYLHDALPILTELSRDAARGDPAACAVCRAGALGCAWRPCRQRPFPARAARPLRSEEHTSELQSRENLVCRLLLEKKNKAYTICKNKFEESCI